MKEKKENFSSNIFSSDYFTG